MEYSAKTIDRATRRFAAAWPKEQIEMLVTQIKHGELEITLRAHGAVEIYRPSSAERIILSASEWVYLQRVCELHGWPMAPPSPSPEG